VSKKTLKETYIEEVLPKLQKELQLTNLHNVPKLTKIVVNVGFGDASTNAKLLDEAINNLTLMTGQKPLITKAKKSIAGFKVREGMPIGAVVTLRGDRMYDFFSKLIGVVLPRIRDFRGLSEKAFDGHGNYNIGLNDQSLFPEIDFDMVSVTRGMNITFCTSTDSDSQAKLLLAALGIPFTQLQRQAS
jgi:large subunit ribosomal protein L5